MAETRQKVGLALALSLLGLCLLCGLTTPVVAVVFADDAARGLMPPVYPGSELVRVAGGQIRPHYSSEHHVYYSGDSTAEVLAFMEPYMPGFKPLQDLPGAGCFHNSRRLLVLPNALSLRRLLPSPRASIVFCPARAGGTEITMSAFWPEP